MCSNVLVHSFAWRSRQLLKRSISASATHRVRISLGPPCPVEPSTPSRPTMRKLRIGQQGACWQARHCQRTQGRPAEESSRCVSGSMSSHQSPRKTAGPFQSLPSSFQSIADSHARFYSCLVVPAVTTTAASVQRFSVQLQ